MVIFALESLQGLFLRIQAQSETITDITESVAVKLGFALFLSNAHTQILKTQNYL